MCYLCPRTPVTHVPGLYTVVRLSASSRDRLVLSPFAIRLTRLSSYFKVASPGEKTRYPCRFQAFSSYHPIHHFPEGLLRPRSPSARRSCSNTRLLLLFLPLSVPASPPHSFSPDSAIPVHYLCPGLRFDILTRLKNLLYNDNARY